MVTEPARGRLVPQGAAATFKKTFPRTAIAAFAVPVVASPARENLRYVGIKSPFQPDAATTLPKTHHRLMLSCFCHFTILAGYLHLTRRALFRHRLRPSPGA